MPRKAITFLGWTRPRAGEQQPTYRTTTYRYADNDSPPTGFMAVATAHFFRPDALLVLVTPQAKAQNLPDLQRDLADHGLPAATPVDIPAGQDEAELWQIFTIIADTVQHGDTLIFDITNGYRSLPVLALIATSYLQAVRPDVTLEKLVYGAYDASEAGITPVFDLTPFVQLLDWTNATTALLQFGRADFRPLVRQSALDGLARHLDSLTLSLHTSRPRQAMEAAAALPDQLATAKQHAAAAPPFALLFDQIAQEYAPLGLAQPNQEPHAALQRMLQIIEWYVQKGLLVQAVTLAREWLISLVRLHLDLPPFSDDRHQQESILNERAPVPALLQPHFAPIKAQWDRIRTPRNDLAHSGMRPNAQAAEGAAARVRALPAELAALLPVHPKGES